MLLAPMIEGAVLDARTIGSASWRVFALMTAAKTLRPRITDPERSYAFAP